MVDGNVVVTWPNSGGNIYYGFALLDAPVHPQPGGPPLRRVSHGTNGAVLPKAPPPSLRLYYLLKGPNSP